MANPKMNLENSLTPILINYKSPNKPTFVKSQEQKLKEVTKIVLEDLEKFMKEAKESNKILALLGFP